MPNAVKDQAGRKARELDKDLHPWEKQPTESKQAWEAFEAFRDSDSRKVLEHGPSAYRWSSEWSWGFRAYEYDKYLARIDQEDLVRFRRKMNDRQRRIAVLAQQKVVQWLTSHSDPAKWSPTEASRVLDVAVRIERLANGGDLPLEDPGSDDAFVATTLADIFESDPESEAALAKMIHEATRVQAQVPR